jgi:hypothetical protein
MPEVANNIFGEAGPYNDFFAFLSSNLMYVELLPAWQFSFFLSDLTSEKKLKPLEAKAFLEKS